MRIDLIADTHGRLDPRIAEAVAGADLLVHAGDVGAGIDEQLAALADPVIIVAGNNDPADCPWPVEQVVDLPGGRLAIMHGHQWPARTRHRRLCERFHDARAVVCGHSHRRVIETDGQPWLLNPGAAGRTRAYGGPGFLRLTIIDERWQIEPHVFEPWRARRPRR
ncbi:metallophosphoesterase family protein [Salinisphaera sp. T31B1]|uniref:metallophosphoesterase family protein n=1 Tax=Salinisphaera sp. T31B1 TaxID=727963 RepID=UPI003341F840